MTNDNRNILIEELKASFGTEEPKGFFLLASDGENVQTNINCSIKTLAHLFSNLEDDTLKDIEKAVHVAKMAKKANEGPLGKILRDIQSALGEEKFNEIAKSILAKDGAKND